MFVLLQSNESQRDNPHGLLTTACSYNKDTAPVFLENTKQVDGHPYHTAVCTITYNVINETLEGQIINEGVKTITGQGLGVCLSLCPK